MEEKVLHWIEGAWTSLDHEESLPVYDPSTGRVQATVTMARASDLDRAVQAAYRAFGEWRNTPVPQRSRIMFKFRDLLEQHRANLAQSVTLENGKNHAEAYAEVGRGIEVVEFACGAPTLMQGDALPNVSRGIDTIMLRYPLGVVGGITPFNFPAMIPLWMLPLALVTGNVMVLKPSERTPRTSVAIVELLLEAGLPDNVIQLVHGGEDVVNGLLTHPLVSAVSFVGSEPVAAHVYRTAAAHGKRVQALAGAKNFHIVMPDAHLAKSVHAIVGSAFGSAGERCLAASVVLAVGDIGDRLVSSLTEAAGRLRLGGSGQEYDLGPVIRSSHRDRILGHIEAGVNEGAVLVRDGRTEAKDREGFFLGATIFDQVDPSMRIAREEIFGPVLSILRTESLDSAIQIANRSQFGNTASIYTQNGGVVRQFRETIEAGMLGVNVGVAAPMAFFPFSGWKNSFYGDLHATGRDAIEFYTDKKVITSRWF